MNENPLELEVNEDGKVVRVVTVTQTEKVLLSSKEIKRQIDEHQAIVDKLQPQYDEVLAFEKANDVKDEEEVEAVPEDETVDTEE